MVCDFSSGGEPVIYRSTRNLYKVSTLESVTSSSASLWLENLKKNKNVNILIAMHISDTFVYQEPSPPTWPIIHQVIIPIVQVC